MTQLSITRGFKLVYLSKLGGFGMIPLSTVSQPAFVASWANAIVELPFRFPEFRPFIVSLVTSSTSSISEALKNSLPSGKQISDYLSSADKVQRHLSSSFHKSESESLLASAPTMRDSARLRSSRGKGAGAWLNVVPTQEVFALNTCEFRLASFLRLGLPISAPDLSTACNCGASLDTTGYHLLTCKTGGGPVWFHECVASVWSECFRELHIHHRREPRNRYTNSNDRPDIIIFDSNLGRNIDLDISLAHPWSTDIFPKSALVDGAAAARRDEKKKKKYGKELLPGGSIAKAIPLILEHFGTWGLEGQCFLQKLAKKSTDEIGRPNGAEFVAVWRKRFSVQLQKCNARVLMRKMATLSRGIRSADSSF